MLLIIEINIHLKILRPIYLSFKIENPFDFYSFSF